VDDMKRILCWAVVALTVWASCAIAEGGAVISEAAGGVNSLYEMRLYTDMLVQNSTIAVEYPHFDGTENIILNAIIYAKIESIVRYAYEWYAYTQEYLDIKCAVTLKNQKVLSMVFWGEAYREDRHENTLITLNIDMLTMKEIKFFHLYDVNDAFIGDLLTNAYEPTAPDTSPYQRDFNEHLGYISDDYYHYRYQTHPLEYAHGSIFAYSDQFNFFLKPDGLVISLPIANVSGSHFEVQLDYEVIEPYNRVKDILR
jgi:hypothetical protein